MHAKRVGIKNLRKYHDFYLQIDTLLLADVFENFRNMFIKIYELDPAKFLTTLGLGWQAPFKDTKVKIDLLTDTDWLLMLEKGITGGICYSIYQYAKLITNTGKTMIEIKNRHFFNIGMQIIYMVEQFHKSFQQIILSG